MKKMSLVFLRLAFADNVQLGFDPTVHLISPHTNDSPTIYEYTVNDRRNGGKTVRFRTKGGPISNFRSASIIGRSTRVWEVCHVTDEPEDNNLGEIKGGTESYVLKDIWMPLEEKMEGEILQEFDDYMDAEDRGFFLTSVADGKICFEDGCEDDTYSAMHGSKEELDTFISKLDIGNPDAQYFMSLSETQILLPDSKQNEKCELTGQSKNAGGIGGDGSLNSTAMQMEKKKQQKIVKRVHYRIVFKERGEALHDLKDMCQMFLASFSAYKGRHWL